MKDSTEWMPLELMRNAGMVDGFGKTLAHILEQTGGH